MRWMAHRLIGTQYAVDLFNNEFDVIEEIAKQGERLFMQFIKFKLDYINTESNKSCMIHDEVDDEDTVNENLNENGKVSANYLGNEIVDNYEGEGVDTGYGPKSSDSVSNICKTLFDQMSRQPYRFASIVSRGNPPYGPNSSMGNNVYRYNENTIMGKYNRMPLPFVEGDSITFSITIKPSPGQSQLTSIPGLTDDDLNRTFNIKLIMTNDPIDNVRPTDNKVVLGTSYTSLYNSSFIQ